MTNEFLIVAGIGLVSLVFIFLISIMFFIKGKAKRISSKMFSMFLILTIFTDILYIVTGIISFKNIEIVQLLGRFVVFSFCVWEVLLIAYLFFAFRSDKENVEYLENNKKKLIVIVAISILICLVLSLVLPFEYKSFESRQVYGLTGPDIITYNVLGVLAYLVCSYLIIKNRKTVDRITKVLFSMCICFLIGTYVLEFVMDEVLNKLPFIMSTIIMFLYLSLESQDAALLEEYNNSVKIENEVSQLKSDFIMNMSHQLRSPMNTILGFTDSLLLNDTITINNLKEDTECIKLSSKRLLELINSILDLSKLESNNDNVLMNEYKLENIIYDVSSNTNAFISKDNLMFSINADENCFNDLIGDANKICKILNILLKNAIMHTEYGEVSLSISSVMIDSSNAEFTYLIKNSGHTMTIDNFNRTFNDIIKVSNDSNFQIDANTLNLVVAKNLIDKIGASIEFINETGKGTQYIIKLKQKVTSNNILGNIREKIQVMHNNNYHVKNLLGKKMLIVDDKNINLVILERLLVQYNVTIDKCLNPRDSIDLILNNNYDIVFLEDSMDDMSGSEVITRLNSTGNRLPFIVGLVNDGSSLKDCEYNDILYTPIKFKDLNKIINNVFGGDRNDL